MMIGHGLALGCLLFILSLDLVVSAIDLHEGDYAGPRYRQAWRVVGNVLLCLWVGGSLFWVIA